MPLKLVNSSRGRPLLVVDNYLFRRDYGSDGKTAWRCVTQGCKARIITRGDDHEEAPMHGHPPDSLKIKLREKLNELRDSAKKTPREVSSSLLVARMVGTVSSEAVRGGLPNFRLMRNQVYYARRGETTVGGTRCAKRQDIDIAEKLKVTSGGSRFLHFDSGKGDSRRLIVFATDENIQLLKENPEWYLDGTFGVCPRSFHQLYSVHVKLTDSTVVPAMFALLPGQDRVSYRRFVEVIVEALDGFHPQALHVDFEVAMIKELETAFPAAGIAGCNFHFNQCVYRKIQHNEVLREKFLTDDDFELGMKMFSALAYVPPDDVQSSFASLLECKFVVENGDILTDFINYFEATWVGRDRNPPLMKLDWWNVHAATQEGMGRTSNEIESWHAVFAARLGASHPSFSTLVEYLKIEQGKTEFVVSNALAQGPSSVTKKKYRDRNKRLQTLVSSYARRPIIQFLESCAHCIAFKVE